MISGLVLAGGAGRRVQGSDKGLLPWHGEPLVVHVVNRLTPQVDQLLVSCNRNRDRYGEIATLTQSDLRADYQGPLAGLEAAAADILHPLLLVVPCDSPALPLDLAERLAAPLQADSKIDITWARCPQRDHYLHALLRTASLQSLPAYLDSGQRAVRHWYSQLNGIPVNFEDAAAFANLNELGVKPE